MAKQFNSDSSHIARQWRCILPLLVVFLCLAGTTLAEPTIPYTDNMKLWLKATDGVTADENGRVSAWADQATDQDGVQNDSNHQPVLDEAAINGYPAVNFSRGGDLANDDYISGPTGGIFADRNGARTIFLVFRPNHSPEQRVVFDPDGNNGSAGNGVQYRITTEMAVRVWGGNIIYNEGASQDQWHVVSLGNTQGASTTGIRLWLNDVEATQKSANDRTMNTGTTGYRIAGNQKGGHSNSYAGHVAEIIVYEEWLSDANRQAVEAYLKQKYVNSNADAGGPYVVAPGGTVELDGTASGGNIATYEWDLDGDGDYDEGLTGPTVSVAYDDLEAVYGMTPGVFDTTLKVTLVDGTVRTGVTSFDMRSYVGNAPVTDLATDSATLNGELFSINGSPTATVRIYWGTSDGGMDTEGWDHVEELTGQAIGTFSAAISGLPFGTKHYMRCYVDVEGGQWAPESLAFYTMHPGPVIYVDADAAGAGNGSSWTDAYTDLQSALLPAEVSVTAAGGNVTEIWVAAGTYIPTTTTDRTIKFEMVEGLAVYGGFAGTEANLEDRDIAANETILSGDIGVADDATDNSYHVVHVLVDDPNVVIDGLTITGGNSEGAANPDGGGIYTEGDATAVANCKIIDNSSSNGGGIFGDVGNLTVTDCFFSGNVATSGGGGAVKVDVGNPGTTIEGSTFVNNTAANHGGAVHLLSGSEAVTDCVFTYNHANGDGSNDANGDTAGAIYSGNNGGVTVTRCAFVGNDAYAGGACTLRDTASMTLRNCSFSGNVATGGAMGGAIHSENGQMIVQNSILWGDVGSASNPEISAHNNSCQMSYCNIMDSGGSGASWPFGNISDMGNNIDRNPGYADADGPDDDFSTGGDLHLLSTAGRWDGTQFVNDAGNSPCIDAGDPLLSTLDEPDPNGGIINMGAYGGTAQASMTPSSPSMGAMINTVAYDSATIDATLVSLGGAASADLTVCWGETDGGADTGNWDNVELAADDMAAPGTVQFDITGLEGNFTYYYRLFDANSVVWDGGTRSFATPHGPVLYVDADAAGAGTGGSWENAFNSPNDALPLANGKQVWVAEGTYKPTDIDERTVSFNLVNNIEFYGGFAGTEANLEDRDVAANETILSGDIGVLDDPLDNSYCVVNCAKEALTDGFTITDGYADGSGSNNQGAGLKAKASGVFYVRNCIFSNNHCTNQGGAIQTDFNGDQYPEITNCLFINNSSDGSGGAINNGTNANITYTNCVFVNNRAAADDAGGNGGAVRLNQSIIELINCTFANNTAWTGSAIVLDGGSTDVTVRNTIVWGNHDINAGSIDYQITRDGNETMAVSYSCIQGLDLYAFVTDNGDNVDTNPLLADAAGGDVHLKSAAGRWDGTQYIADAATSPCIDTGDPADDASGEPAPNGGIINMGAYGGTAEASLSAGGPIIAVSNATNPTTSSAMVNGTLLALGGGGDPDVTIYFGETDGGSNPVAWDDSVTIGATPLGDFQGAVNGLAAGHDYYARARADNSGSGGGIAWTAAPIQFTAQHDGIIYVDAAAAGADNGTSWADAYTDLQDALASARNGNVTAVYIAGGTYKPTDDTDRTKWFELVFGVNVYGGFNGEADPADRDPNTPPTILSGDIGAADDITDNSYHVLMGADQVTIDGLTVTGGNASAGEVGDTLNNKGGGMLLEDVGDFTMIDCNFIGNRCYWRGGAIQSRMGTGLASITATGCQFIDNHQAYPTGPGDGGGAINNGNAVTGTYTNCVFANNTTTERGGALRFYRCDVTVTNCTFTGNSADQDGGGISQISQGTLAVKNSILWDDSAPVDSEIYCDPAVLTVDYSCISGGGFDEVGTGNFDANPAFADAANGDVHLMSVTGRWDGTQFVNDAYTSPCIDAGDPADSFGIETAPNGDRINIGAWGNTVEASRTEGGLVIAVRAPTNILSTEATLNGAVTVVPADDPTVTMYWGDEDGGTDTGAWDTSISFGSVGVGEFSSDVTGLLANTTYYYRCVGTTSGGDNWTIAQTFTTPGIIYVNQNVAGGDDDGTSWANAYDDLQDALTDPEIGTGDEIWVAAGEYKPSIDDPAVSFMLVPGTKLYGGFAGGEAELDLRDADANPVILSGDIDGDGTLEGGNSYNVVQAATNTLLDSVTVTLGNTEGGPYASGGGMRVDGSISKADVANCTFDTNKSVDGGGSGIKNEGDAHLTVVNSTFINGWVTNDGAAINSQGQTTLIGCTFRDCISMREGGGVNIADNSEHIIAECTFTNNDASRYGGGLMLGGAGAIVSDCVFEDNHSGDKGAGIRADTNTNTITNCQFINNTSDDQGGGIWTSKTATIDGCDFQGNLCAAGGGAILLESGSMGTVVSDCTFFDNEALNNGGAIHSVNNDSIVVNGLFVGNKADSQGTGNDGCGGAWAPKNGAPSMVNCTLYGNSARTGGGIGAQGANPITARNVILWNNTATGQGSQIGTNPGDAATVDVFFSCIQDGWPDALESISDDPLFVDTENDDFHVQSTAGHWTPGGFVPDAAMSPCVDTGDPADDYSNEPVDNANSRINMGAYGNTPQASKSAVPGSIILGAAVTELLPNVSEPLTISFDPPAPDDGIVVEFDYDPQVVDVSPDPAVVLTNSGEVTVTGIALGTTTVVASAVGYEDAEVEYTVSGSSVPGDVDLDQCVNVADLLTVRNNLGESGSNIFPPAADVTGDDDIVNVADLLYVRNRLGDGQCPE